MNEQLTWEDDPIVESPSSSSDDWKNDPIVGEEWKSDPVVEQTPSLSPEDARKAQETALTVLDIQTAPYRADWSAVNEREKSELSALKWLAEDKLLKRGIKPLDGGMVAIPDAYQFDPQTGARYTRSKTIQTPSGEAQIQVDDDRIPQDVAADIEEYKRASAAYNERYGEQDRIAAEEKRKQRMNQRIEDASFSSQMSHLPETLNTFAENAGLNALPAAGAAGMFKMFSTPGARGLQKALPYIAGLVGGGATGELQEKAISAFETPEETADRRTRLAQEAESNPRAALLGRLAGGSVLFRPSVSQIRSAVAGNPAAQAEIGMGAVIGGGMSAGGAAMEGRMPTLGELGEGILGGALFNKPTALGRAFVPKHAIPGTPENTVKTAMEGAHTTEAIAKAVDEGFASDFAQPRENLIRNPDIVPEGPTAPPETATLPELVARFQDTTPKEPTQIGITPKKSKIPDIAAKPASVNPTVETRWNQARGITGRKYTDVLKEKIQNVARSFTRADPLLDPKTDGEVIDAVRMIRAAPEIARAQSIETIRGLTGNLGKNGYELFSRDIILRDLLKDIDRGLYDEGKNIPFGYKDRAEVVTDLGALESALSTPDVANSNIRDALAARKQVMTGIRDEMVSRDLLPEAVQDFDDYFHRQVLEFYNQQEAARTGGQHDARVKRKGFQKKRIGGQTDYNTSYLESEYEVMSQMLQQIGVHDQLARIRGEADIRPRLEGMAATARAAGEPDANWREFVPDGYKTWQPEKGRYFFPAKTISEGVLNDFLSGTKTLTEADFKDMMAIGGKKTEYVLPERVADTLDNLNRRPEGNVIGDVASKINRAWKKWQLVSPPRLAKYVINNHTGDLDIVMGYRPEILAEVPSAEREMWNDFRGKKSSPLLQEARAMGVLDAGWSASEIPEVHQHKALARLEPGDHGKLRKAWDTYWGGASDIARWREGVLRLASYKWFKKQIQDGRTNLYGASKQTEINSIKDGKYKAAKLARELIGDYGNISQAGSWIREKVIPFWSWMEINAPRYYRLFKNMPRESGGGSYARLGGAIASTAARSFLTPAKMAAFTGLVWLFNNSTQERRKMTEELGERGQNQLVLGRDEDGTVQSLRVQGALSDALSWAGLENAPTDVMKMMSGERTAGEQAQEMAMATPKKLIGASLPIPKTMLETAGKFTMYPDPFNPRPIRDRAQYVARGLSLGTYYDKMAGIPTRVNSVKDALRNAVVYTTNPEEQKYFAARNLVSEFLKKQGDTAAPFSFTDKQNALYYFKLAAQQGNKALAERWLRNYVKLGGTKSGVVSSVQSMNPLSSLSKRQRAEFMDSLSQEKKQIVEASDEYSAKSMDAVADMMDKIDVE